MNGESREPEKVNADLWRDNRRKWKISTFLFVAGFLVILALMKVRLPRPILEILLSAAFLTYLAGLVGLHWARAESDFLRKPDPKQPPSLWKFGRR
jgi:hypothetical protein